MSMDARLLPEQAPEPRVFTDAEMITLRVSLNVEGHELALAVPESEWLKLVNDFRKMQVVERQRVGASIRNATAHDPFPTDGSDLTEKQQEVCDIFVSDCILLAALAEAAGPRMLTETAVEKYEIIRGNIVKPRLN